MGKPFFIATLIVFAFCFSSALAHANRNEHFYVQGKVYCDPCRFEFETRLSRPLSGVKVSLECRRPENGTLTYFNEAYTDKLGFYNLIVSGDHEEEICKLMTVKSTHADCNEAMMNSGDNIVLTDNMGISSLVRYVNPLGFKTPDVNPECALIFKELGLDKLDD